MARVANKQGESGTMPSVDAGDRRRFVGVLPHRLECWPEPFGALADELPAFSIGDIKAARREALESRERA